MQFIKCRLSISTYRTDECQDNVIKYHIPFRQEIMKGNNDVEFRASSGTLLETKQLQIRRKRNILNFLVSDKKDQVIHQPLKYQSWILIYQNQCNLKALSNSLALVTKNLQFQFTRRRDRWYFHVYLIGQMLAKIHQLIKLLLSVQLFLSSTTSVPVSPSVFHLTSLSDNLILESCSIICYIKA